MPIYYSNELVIHGPANEIKRFKDGLKIVDGYYDIVESYMPALIGSIVRDNDTALDKESPNQLIISSVSAWIPLIGAISKVSELFPILYFFLEFSGDNVCGYCRWLNGGQIDYEEHYYYELYELENIHEDSKETKDTIKNQEMS